jgi:ABC-type multidrug transport system fused ATPase/permease subunit
MHIDNISQSLQQTLSQSITSLLMVIGVIVMMFVTSPLLALVALLTVPISIFVTKRIAKRSQKMFVAQWRTTGELNGHIEEAFTGHSLVKVFGRQPEVEQTFRSKNAELYKSSFGAQFISGTVLPAMFFVGNLNYVLLAVIGGVLGMILALLIAFLQINFKLIPLTGETFLIDYFPVKLQAADFLLVGITVFLITFFAAWLPARKAAGSEFSLRSE